MLDELKKRLAEVQARKNALLAQARAEARTFGVDENAEFLGLESQELAIQNQIDIEQRQAAANAEPARPRVVNAPAVLTRTTKAQRAGDKFKGQSVARFAMAAAKAHLQRRDVAHIMEETYGRTRPELARLARAWRQGGPGCLQADTRRVLAANEIAGGGTGSGDWGHELVSLDGEYTGDFIELLREKTVFDQLPLRVVPTNVTIKGQDGTGTAYWVGEHKPIPMSAQDYSSVNLTPLKVGALTAISLELVEDSSPAAEQLVADSLVADSAQLIDAKFFSADAASNGVSPAGMVNSLSGTASSGTDLQGLITDVDVLVQTFIAAKNTGGLVLASRPALAQKIAGFLTFAGAPMFPQMSEVGGIFQNKPFHTSDNVVSGDLLMLKPEDIYRIGDSGLRIDISTEATLEMASDPTGAGDATPVGQSKQPVSLYQAGMIGIRLFRRINWAKRRSTAVARITGAAYVPQVQTA